MPSKKKNISGTVEDPWDKAPTIEEIRANENAIFYEGISEPIETRNPEVLAILKELKDEVLTILPKIFHRFYLQEIHPRVFSLLLNCSQSGTQLMEKIPFDINETKCTQETTIAIIILGLKQHFDWLISKYRTKIYLLAPELVVPNARFTDMDWIEASVRHANRFLLIDPPYRKLQKDFISSTRERLPFEIAPQFDLMIDLMGNTQGYWMIIDEQMIAPFMLFCGDSFFNYLKEQALYYLSLEGVPPQHLSLDSKTKADRSTIKINPLDDICLYNAIKHALSRRDFTFFVQMGDTVRKPRKAISYVLDLKKLQLFLIDHWKEEHRGVGPLCTMSIKDLEKICKVNGFGNLTAHSIEKTRQRLGLITFRNGKIGAKDYIVNW